MRYEWAVFSTLVANNPHSYHNDCDSLHHQSPSPESVMLKKEAFQLLSDEAKELIAIVLNAPSEIMFDCGKPSIMRIYDILRSNEWTWPKINRARSEVKQYVKTF
jgi:hypothetical protein